MKAAINANAIKMKTISETRDTYIEVLCQNTPSDDIREAIANRIAAKRIVFANAAAKDQARRLAWIKTKSAPNKPTFTEQNQEEKKRKWLKKSKYQRLVKKQKKQRLSIIFNYSSVTLTKEMESLLNGGLDYSVLPDKLNLTQVLVDFKRFERSMLWTEFWSGKPKEDYKPPHSKIRRQTCQQNIQLQNL